MGNFFSKFFMSFSSKKNKGLPAGNADDISYSSINSVNTTTTMASKSASANSSGKTLASFDLIIEKPKYVGAIPEATIKYYPLD